jgi:outer membrane receptor protein involved in Fe transport
MTISARRNLRAALLIASALGGVAVRGVALAQSTPPATSPDAAPLGSPPSEVVVTAAKTTRSAIALGGGEIQKILPGVNPLKAIQTLPGVLFETADPWGNDEQNEEVFVHGFTTQQLGYTMDGVPLGDQQYGNYNGLSPSRAVTSENVSKVVLSSGAGALGVASTSNLGGAIETFSNDPKHQLGGTAEEVLGSYDTTRTFLRIDSGDTAYGAGYLSYLHQDARAWDFNGHQKDDQINAKYVNDIGHGKLTLFLDYDYKVDPNEDAISYGNQQTAAAAGFIPYTRPYLYPNLAAAESYLTSNPAAPGTPPAAQGNNFSNYFSAEQREDLLGYAKYDYKFNEDLTWSNQVYYHYDYGRGIVAGPVNNAGLPGLFATYYPGLIVGSSTSAASLTNLVNLFGGTGYEVRTTEYHINRGGLISTLNWQLGQHQIEAGVWYEHNDEGQHRVWYPFSSANDDLTPYDIPHGPSVFTQDAVNFSVDEVQFHLQDQWRILPQLLLQAGFKTTYQNAGNTVLINQKNLPTVAVPVVFPTGSISTTEGFLPQFGALWDVTAHEQVFANIQENVRQFIPYSQGGNFYGTSPWNLGTQAAFNLFKSTVNPESSWTYEVGVRSHRPVDLGLLTSIEGQASVYHVDFSNRILNIAPYNFINPAPSILVNVGGVTTNGVDIAGTLNFGPHFHLYDGLSYNKSTYDSNYDSGTATVGGVTSPVVVATGGKTVPGEPDWLNKTILSTNYGPFEAQVSGDFVGRRYATYLNDLSVKSTFLVGLEGSYVFRSTPVPYLQTAKLALNVTNLGDVKGISTLVTTSASGGYQGYPIAPRMVFVTLSAGF